MGGAVLPAGTHLDFRFYIGSSKSTKRTCAWNQFVNPASLWTPKGSKPPPEVLDDRKRLSHSWHRDLPEQGRSLQKASAGSPQAGKAVAAASGYKESGTSQ